MAHPEIGGVLGDSDTYAVAEARAAAHGATRSATSSAMFTLSSFGSSRWCDLIAIVGIVALAIRRWSLIGTFPTGLDGAQWLALGRGLHGFGRSTDGAYAPLVPVLTTLADALLGPLPAVRLIATASALALALSLWLVARAALGSCWGLVAAGIVLPASALAEPVLYGGYPQQFALAAGLVGIWMACAFLTAGGWRNLFAVALAALVAASAHHVYFPLAIISITTTGLLWATSAAPEVRWQRVWQLAVALAPSLLLFAATTIAFARAGYSAPLAASARDVAEAWQYATREAPLVWLALILASVVALAAAWHQREAASWLLATSLVFPAGVLASLSGQARLIPPVLIGTAIAVTLGTSEVSRHFRASPLPLGLSLAALAAGLALSADRAAADYAEFYRVVDPSLVRAANAIAADDAPGSVAVRQDRRGWPIGWWFEALQQRPVIAGSDPRWLGFPGERANARVADALFDGHLDAETFRARAEAAHVRYLVIPKWDWIGWDRWLRRMQFPVKVLFDDNKTLVLQVVEPEISPESDG